MTFLLYILLIFPLVKSDTDCGHLNESNAFSDSGTTFQYNGQCCTDEAVEYLDNSGFKTTWRLGLKKQLASIKAAIAAGKCEKTTTTTKKCKFQAY
ncbi:unnamed protein product [Caenorhabditis angaria]|uniref:DUF19 domain-containing protein n=1 Tax=Caenorhabditis angaria TaxID=860376 RepID=A0A9P1MZ32_9PELO|nr:unnamed protein product [Caenorhabditis angaria]